MLLFKELSSPNTNNENEFKSSLIPKTSHRVAKNSKGLPSILINTMKDDSLVSNYKGANILLRFKENCKIHEENKSSIFKNNLGQYRIINIIVDGINLGLIFRNQFQDAYLENDSDLDIAIESWKPTTL